MHLPYESESGPANIVKTTAGALCSKPLYAYHGDQGDDDKDGDGDGDDEDGDDGDGGGGALVIDTVPQCPRHTADDDEDDDGDDGDEDDDDDLVIDDL